MDIRRLQLTGGNSYVVSLPKSWVEDVGLRAKDPVMVLPQADMSLLVVPKYDLRRDIKSEATVEIKDTMDKDAALRAFISYYLAGYDLINVNVGVTGSHMRAFLKETIRRKLIGIEIVEETSSGIVTQFLSGHADLPLKRAIQRMSIITAGMAKDAIVSLQKRDLMLAEEVSQRDDEVDRFYHFIMRQLNMAVRNRAIIADVGLSSARDCLGYRMAIKSVERVADHAASIAKSVPNLHLEALGHLTKDFVSMGDLSVKVFEGSVNALVRLDTKIANDSINMTKKVIELDERINEELLTAKMDLSTVGWLRLTLESVRRVAEYGSDIAEIAVDLTVREPRPSEPLDRKLHQKT